MKGKNKRISVTIKCLLVTLFIVIVLFGIGGGFLYSLWDSIISFSGYGSEIAVRIILSLIVLIIIIIAKNQYVFTQKRVGFFKSFKYAFPYIILPTSLIVLSIIGTPSSNTTFVEIIGFILMYVMVGVFEEFLCRGWALNELLEVFKNDRRGVIASIGISSIIFGLLHSVNFLGSNPLLVIFQIIAATVFGIYIGSIYYRTKNIWICVFLHAYWDMSLSLTSELLVPEYCSSVIETSSPSLGVMLISFIVIILPVILYDFLCSSLLLGKDDLNPLLDEKTELPLNYERKNKRFKLFTIIGILIIAFIFSASYYAGNINDSDSCPKYVSIEPSSYKEEISHIDSYSINYFDTNGNINNYSVDLTNEKMLIKNISTNEEFSINNIISVEVLNINNKYVIIYLDNTGRTYISYKLNSNNIYNSEFMNEFKESFESVKIPDSYLIGKYTDVTNKKEYPLIISNTKDRYLLDGNTIYKY